MTDDELFQLWSIFSSLSMNLGLIEVFIATFIKNVMTLDVVSE